MIRVRELSKRYVIYRRPWHRLVDWFTPGRVRVGAPFWALRDVSFDLERGCSMGIVGVNGAGKSTLLKILTGTTEATEGEYSIQGRVSSLLELGTGFHPEFTGRQNIAFGGKMAGLTEQELAGKFEAIIEFAELERFIDQPVRTYSSGMLLRLGFALASSVDPDVLIIDEALSVGDLHFQQKCLKRIKGFIERGTTVMFVSHDPGMVKRFCTEAILLDGGRLLDHGKPDQVLDYYTALLAEKYREGGSKAAIVKPGEDGAEGEAADTAAQAAAQTEAPLPWQAPPLVAKGHRTGNFSAVITSIWLEADGVNGNTHMVVTGAAATIRVRWVAFEDVPAATVGFVIKDRLGQEIFGVNTAYREVHLDDVRAGQTVEVAFGTEMNMGEGLYSVGAALHVGESHETTCYDWVEHAFAFQVLPNPLERHTGLCKLPVRIGVEAGAAPPGEMAFAQTTRRKLLSRAGGAVEAIGLQ